MSVYNDEQYLCEAIDSILNQTFKDFEFLIINDGSDDNTKRILERYNDPRIIIHNNPKNMGLAKSLNIGLRLARGEYIARQDADDISLPERLSEEVDFLSINHAYAAVGVFPIMFYEHSGEKRYCQRPVSDLQIKKTLKTENCITHGSAMIRKECLTDVGFYNESMEKSQDFELWLRLSKKYSLKNISKFLYIRRLHKKNLEIEYMTNQQIFVALAKIKNDSLSIKKTTEQFLSTIAKYCSVPSKIDFVLKCIKRLTSKKINAYNLFRVFYKIRFTYGVQKIFNDVRFERIDFRKAKLRINKTLDGRLIDLFIKTIKVLYIK